MGTSVATKKVRVDVPQKLADDVLHANRHTCCWCHEPRQPVEIHHINSDPGDNRWENLAVLCRNDHGTVSNTGPLGRGYSPGEVRRRKKDWEEECAAGEAEEPEEQDHEVVVVRSGECREWIYRLAVGETIVVGLDSDVAVDAMIATRGQFKKWCDDEEHFVHDSKEDVFECELEVEADVAKSFVFWIQNDEDEDACVEVDIAVWAQDDEDD